MGGREQPSSAGLLNLLELKHLELSSTRSSLEYESTFCIYSSDALSLPEIIRQSPLIFLWDHVINWKNIIHKSVTSFDQFGNKKKWQEGIAIVS